jgi:hypothetical protein
LFHERQILSPRNHLDFRGGKIRSVVAIRGYSRFISRSRAPQELSGFDGISS